MESREHLKNEYLECKTTEESSEKLKQLERAAKKKHLEKAARTVTHLYYVDFKLTKTGHLRKALEKVEQLALNLYRTPWKRELYTLKEYGALIQNYLKPALSNYEDLLKVLGYEKQDHLYVLNIQKEMEKEKFLGNVKDYFKKIFKDKISKVAFDLYILQVREPPNKFVEFSVKKYNTDGKTAHSSSSQEKDMYGSDVDTAHNHMQRSANHPSSSDIGGKSHSQRHVDTAYSNRSQEKDMYGSDVDTAHMHRSANHPSSSDIGGKSHSQRHVDTAYSNRSQEKDMYGSDVDTAHMHRSANHPSSSDIGGKSRSQRHVNTAYSNRSQEKDMYGSDVDTAHMHRSANHPSSSDIGGKSHSQRHVNTAHSNSSQEKDMYGSDVDTAHVHRSASSEIGGSVSNITNKLNDVTNGTKKEVSENSQIKNESKWLKTGQDKIINDPPNNDLNVKTNNDHITESSTKEQERIKYQYYKEENILKSEAGGIQKTVYISSSTSNSPSTFEHESTHPNENCSSTDDNLSKKVFDQKSLNQIDKQEKSNKVCKKAPEIQNKSSIEDQPLEHDSEHGQDRFPDEFDHKGSRKDDSFASNEKIGLKTGNKPTEHNKNYSASFSVEANTGVYLTNDSSKYNIDVGQDGKRNIKSRDPVDKYTSGTKSKSSVADEQRHLNKCQHCRDPDGYQYQCTTCRNWYALCKKCFTKQPFKCSKGGKHTYIDFSKTKYKKTTIV